MRALSALNFGEMGNVLSAPEEQQATMENLLSKLVTLEMDALALTEQGIHALRSQGEAA